MAPGEQRKQIKLWQVGTMGDRNCLQLQFPEQIALWRQKASFSALKDAEKGNGGPGMAMGGGITKVPSNAFDGCPGRPTAIASFFFLCIYIFIYTEIKTNNSVKMII